LTCENSSAPAGFVLAAVLSGGVAIKRQRAGAGLGRAHGGINQPTGVITALAGNSGSVVNSATTDTLVSGDGFNLGLAQIERRNPLDQQIDIDLFHPLNPSRTTGYMSAVARRNRTGQKRVGPSRSQRQCAAPPSAPRIKLKNGLTCAKNHRPRRATAPDFPACACVPDTTGTQLLKTSCRNHRERGRLKWNCSTGYL
jgi:hypothetical protein